MSADNTNYKSCFVKCMTKEIDGSLSLDLPFPIYWQNIIYNGVNHYEHIPAKDIEVIAFIHYAISDEEKVKAYKGYIGDKWKEVSKNADINKHWNKTKADSLAITNIDKSGKETITKYDGVDKDEIAHPYVEEK